jgi:phosphoribosylformylglycinamidine cyclo-ligase
MAKRLTYKGAGVDVAGAHDLAERIRRQAARTLVDSVIAGPGGFAGLVRLDMAGYREPVLVSTVDGVGTKLKIAFQMDKHDTVGIDLVAMCVNDLICCGAKPLAFMDYLATGKLVPELAERIIEGIVEGCCQAEAALVGGETAEMPGFYSRGEYDLAGFAVGLVERGAVVDGTAICPGDRVIGLESSGLHSNGYSLVREVVFDKCKLGLDEEVPELGGCLGDVLLTPTRIYVREVLALAGRLGLHGIVHITGGAFEEKVPRVVPPGCCVVVRKGTWDVPPVFRFLQDRGELTDEEMFGTFNMGIGMIVISSAEDCRAAIDGLASHGVTAWPIGWVEERKADKGASRFEWSV